MSAQGGTLQRRGTIELPIWPVAVLVVAAVAAAVGMTLLRDAGQTSFVTSVTDSQRFANSTAAVREQGAVAPAIPSIRPISPAVLENSTAAIREQGAALPLVVGISHVAPRPPSVGGANEALHRQYSPPQESTALRIGRDPIMVNGEACMQCR